MRRGKEFPPAPRSRRFGRRLLAVLAALAAAAGVVWAVARMGEEARRGIWVKDRYRVRFDAVECDPPPGRDRLTFLAEVRYLSNAPETISVLDPELAPKLAAAFAQHPWVASCVSLKADPAGGIRVILQYRSPVMVVRTITSRRVVDGGGILLPLEAESARLPELISPLPDPTSPAGKPWMDEAITQALALVEAHHPRTLEKTTTGWRLILPSGTTLVR